ncbi:helix-turn-helix transcriptional regulator [Rosenbergiella nectarea]|uniref:helix-turn-helix transcriptional regulator n=1 Tax=Rosenbergiella nectarea TaxID=988801 RepID=UPI003B82C6FF
MSKPLSTTDGLRDAMSSKYAFSTLDHEILRSYESIVGGLALMLGDHCEIVLHALDNLESSAICIANGELTGRRVGSPITNLALQTLHELNGRENPPFRTRFTRSKSGALMKSTTIAIKNSSQRVIGLLCINMNLDVPFSQILATFCPSEAQHDSHVHFASSVDDLVLQTLEHTIEEVSNDRSVANNSKNKQIVLNLYAKGIFDIKDAINQVADRLNISKHTVYLYIRQFRHEDFPEGEE